MKQSRRGWLLYALAWVPPALFYMIALTVRGDARFVHAIVSGAFMMAVAALEGVVVWRLSGRLDMDRTRRVAFFALHMAAALVYTAVWLGALLGWMWLVAGADVAAFIFQQAGVWQFLTGLWIYALVAGIAYLIRTQRRLREREVAAARAEAIAAQAQLDALRAQLHAIRAQLNPHFLFNALHALGALVRHDGAAAEEALDRLGDLLRYALDHGVEGRVPLRDEWTFTQNYIALERIRLGDRLRIEVRMDEDALDESVPPFVLQPLVENAIRHGIAVRPEGGTLRVYAYRKGDRLLLEVADDGPGADAPSLESSAGLGLRAIRQQLASWYDGDARVHVHTHPGQGFQVTVTMPANGRVSQRAM